MTDAGGHPPARSVAGGAGRSLRPAARGRPACAPAAGTSRRRARPPRRRPRRRRPRPPAGPGRAGAGSPACTERSSGLGRVDRAAHGDPVGRRAPARPAGTGSPARSSAAAPAGRPGRAGRSAAARRSAGTRRPGRTRPGASRSTVTPRPRSRTSGSRAARRPRRGPGTARAPPAGSSAPDGHPGQLDLRRARDRFGHHAPSRLWPQTRTTLPVTAAGGRRGQPGDRLRHVHRQAALGQAVHPAARLAEHQRHPRGHPGLDEAGRDRVDGDPALGEQPAPATCDQPDHARPCRWRSWSGPGCRRCRRSRRRRSAGHRPGSAPAPAARR